MDILSLLKMAKVIALCFDLMLRSMLLWPVIYVIPSAIVAVVLLLLRKAVAVEFARPWIGGSESIGVSVTWLISYLSVALVALGASRMLPTLRPMERAVHQLMIGLHGGTVSALLIVSAGAIVMVRAVLLVLFETIGPIIVVYVFARHGKRAALDCIVWQCDCATDVIARLIILTGGLSVLGRFVALTAASHDVPVMLGALVALWGAAMLVLASTFAPLLTVERIGNEMQALLRTALGSQSIAWLLVGIRRVNNSRS